MVTAILRPTIPPGPRRALELAAEFSERLVDPASVPPFTGLDVAQNPGLGLALGRDGRKQFLGESIGDAGQSVGVSYDEVARLDHHAVDGNAAADLTRTAPQRAPMCDSGRINRE